MKGTVGFICFPLLLDTTPPSPKPVHLALGAATISNPLLPNAVNKKTSPYLEIIVKLLLNDPSL